MLNHSPQVGPCHSSSIRSLHWDKNLHNPVDVKVSFLVDLVRWAWWVYISFKARRSKEGSIALS